MKRGTDNASLFGESFGSEQQGYSSNMKLMMIIAAFLIVTIGLILVQPNVAPNQLAENEPTELTKTADLANAPSANYSNSEALVTRSETSLLSIGARIQLASATLPTVYDVRQRCPSVTHRLKVKEHECAPIPASLRANVINFMP